MKSVGSLVYDFATLTYTALSILRWVKGVCGEQEGRVRRIRARSVIVEDLWAKW